jgi:AraC family transcriptional regulator of adaptative response/methylated-DNA-[protein]-cysteine methyltransferase
MKIFTSILEKMNETLDDIYYKALVDKDSSYEGSFIVGVKTTGVLCRPTCTARKPKRENVEFFPTTREALLKGYRPCKICRPLEKLGETPEVIKKILDALNANPSKKFKDWDLRHHGVEPAMMRRWFLKHHGMTFHSYQRTYRFNLAFKRIKGGENITNTAFDSGFESLSGFNDSFKSIFGVSPKMSKEQSIIDLCRLETPLGTMFACATEKGICLLEFTDRKMLETEFKTLAKLLNAHILPGDNPHFHILKQELEEYFKGERQVFTVPLFSPGTIFQNEVWACLLKIPYGETRSYAQQALAINKRTAIRAVANANGMNRLCILVPCHRVIGADGSLTGFGGGLWRKRWLLDMESMKMRPNLFKGLDLFQG